MLPVLDPAWHVGVITISTYDHESRRIQAEIYGYFGVHRPVGGSAKKNRWNITHIPTGRLVCYVRLKEDAKMIVELLHTYREEFSSSSAEEIRKSMPKFITDWLKRCQNEGKYAELEVPND